MSSKRKLRVERLENRSLLAVSPIGGDIVLAENPVGTEQPRLASLAVLPNGSAIAVANSRVPLPMLGSIDAVNEPVESFIDFSSPNTITKLEASPNGSLTAANLNTAVDALYATTCSIADVGSCTGAGIRVSDFPQLGGWGGPRGQQLARRDSEAFIVWEQNWNGPAQFAIYDHRIQGIFVDNRGLPTSGAAFTIPGSEASDLNSYEGPSVAVSNASDAAVVAWRENGLPMFSLRDRNGTWTKRGVSAYGPVVDIDFVEDTVVAMADDGSFAAAWIEHDSTIVLGQPTQRTEALAVQLFDANGNPTRKRILQSGDRWSNVDIDMRGDGSFVLVAIDSSSADIVYFEFDKDATLQPYYTGALEAVYSSTGEIFFNPSRLPRVNRGSDGWRLAPRVEVNADSFRVAWTKRGTDITSPWQIQTRLFAENADDIVGRVGRSNRTWLGSLDYSDPDDDSSMNLIRLEAFPADQRWGDVLIGDFNGDGNDVGMARSLTTGEWWMNNGISVEPRGTWSTRVDWGDFQVADFDGDGDDDIAGRVAQNGAWWVGLSNDSAEMTNEFFGNWTSRVSWTNIQQGDFNGDGRADLLGRTSTNGAWWVALSDGAEFSNERWGIWTTRQQWLDVAVGDFNGDGLDDVAGRVAASGAWYVGISNADFFDTTPWGRWSTRVRWKNVVVGDFNDDGRDDIAGQTGTNQWWVAQSSFGEFRDFAWGAWLAGADYVDVLTGDFNGDGREDIIGRDRDEGIWVAGFSTGLQFSSFELGTWSTRFPWTDVQTVS